MNEKDFEDLCQSLSIYLAAVVYDCSSFFLPREVTVSPQFATQWGNFFLIHFIPSDIQYFSHHMVFIRHIQRAPPRARGL